LQTVRFAFELAVVVLFSTVRVISFSLLYFTRRDSHTPFY
jgi:hypothetical protein